MGDAAEHWRNSLAAWALPPQILAAAPESPYGFPVEIFDRAAAEAAESDTPSRRRSSAVLRKDGSVLDVGCGAGAASLALVDIAGRITGVDESATMLEAFARRAGKAGIDHRAVQGRWPDVAPDVDPADVVVCHHVFYNVGDLDTFASELDGHAHRRVVVELTERHPLHWMNALWDELHGLTRPDGPTASDALDVLTDLGLAPEVERWDQPFRLAADDPEALVTFARRRLCLSTDRDDELARAVRKHPPPSARSVVTVWWDHPAS